jgi:hypothetical protein
MKPPALIRTGEKMKNFSWIFLVLTLLWPQPGFAGKWIKTGTTFDPGLYLVCDTVVSEPHYCILVDHVGTMEEVEQFVDLFNEDPIAQPDITKWWRWKDGYWIKYKPPFKYIDGELM